MFKVAVAIFVVASVGASAQSQVPPDIMKLLASIKAADKGQLAASEEDGRFMRVLIITSGAKHALEIGGADGYSAIWMGLGLRQTGGHLTTIEYDAGRAKSLAENIRRAGLTRSQLSPATRSRKSRRSPARSTSCFSTRGKPTTSVFWIWCSHGSRRADCFSRTTS